MNKWRNKSTDTEWRRENKNSSMPSLLFYSCRVVTFLVRFTFVKQRGWKCRLHTWYCVSKAVDPTLRCSLCHPWGHSLYAKQQVWQVLAKNQFGVLLHEKKIAAVFALILLRLVLRTKPCFRAISFSQARRNDLHPVTQGIVSYSYKLL